MNKRKTLNIIDTLFKVLEHSGFIITFFSLALLITFLTTGTEKVIVKTLDSFFILIILTKILYGLFTIYYQRTSQKGIIEFAVGCLFLGLYWATHYITNIEKAGELKQLFEQFSIILRTIIYSLFLIFNKRKISVYLKSIKLNPAQSFSLGFILLILLGVWLLSLPYATVKPVGFLDKLFISTSAVCVTGLVTLDIGTSFSLFGQVVILMLIQLGALGIMSLLTFLIIFSGQRMGFYERSATLEAFDQNNFLTLKRLMILMIVFTFSIEAIGALLIFISSPAGTLVEKIFFSIFHSISAFCNAGFSTLPDSLMQYYGSFNINMVISGLIIMGGLGFPVILNIKEKFFDDKPLQLHSKIVLLTSLILIVLGTILFLADEYQHSLKDLSGPQKVMASFFQSVTTRTAGFNTIDMAHLQPTTYLWMIFLMFIGASPGSTGGGLKTTTFFILVMAVYLIVKKTTTAYAFKRRIRGMIFIKAGVLFALRALIIFVATILLLYYEDFKFLDVLFEVVSAFSTVGLTTGITPALSSAGKIIIILLMFIGRLGPLNILASISSKRKNESAVEYADGYLVIG